MPDRNTNRTSRRGFLKSVGALAGAGSMLASAGSVEASRSAKKIQPSFGTETVEIESHDGTTLMATFYKPNTSRPVPVVVMTHGWAGNRSNLQPLASAYAEQGFAVLAYDSRGFGESGGKVSLNGPKEVKDVSSIIDWLAGRSEVMNVSEGNPRVGMEGGSYGGAIQMLAAANEDRIDAIVPRITWNNLIYSLAPHGVLKSLWFTQLYQGGVARSNGLDPTLQKLFQEANQTQGVPSNASKYFEPRSPASVMDEIDTPTLLIHGWHDTLFKPNEAIRNYTGLKKNGVDVSLIFHDAGHGHNHLYSDKQRQYVTGVAIKWMSKQLLGKEIATPPVSVYIGEDNEFRNLKDFPSQFTKHMDMSLAGAEDSDEYDAMTFLYNNGFENEISEVTYDFKMDRPMELLGTPTLDLGVYSFGSSPQLFAELYHVSGGSQELIGDQVLPFRIVQDTMRLELPSIQRRFASGDKLRLKLSTQSNRYANVNEFFAAMVADGTPSKLSVPTFQPPRQG